MRLAPDGATVLVPAPIAVEPPGRATLTEVVVSVAGGEGTYGAYCRGDARSRYELTLSTEGRLALNRVDGDGSRELSGDVGREYPRPGPAILRLICVEEGDELTFVVSLDALGTFEVTDPDPLPVPTQGGTGVVATGSVEVDVESARVWLAE
jgi:hypothetical protein